MTGVDPAEIDSGDLAVAIGQQDLDKTLQVESLGGDTIKRGDSECSLTLLMCGDCCGESNSVLRNIHASESLSSDPSGISASASGPHNQAVEFPNRIWWHWAPYPTGTSGRHLPD